MVGEEFGLNTTALTNSVYSGIGTAYDTVMWIIAIGVVLGLILTIMWIASFKHEVIIRYRTQSRKFIIKDKAKEVIIDGVPYWRLLKMKKKVTVPMPDALEITKKGRFYAECYWDADNPEPVWIKDTGVPDVNLQPFTTRERAVHVAGITKALTRKKKGLLETLEKLAVPIALVLILIVILIFFENIAKPAQDMAVMNKQMTADNMKISEQNARIISVIMGKIDSNEIKINQNVNTPAPPEDNIKVIG